LLAFTAVELVPGLERLGSSVTVMGRRVTQVFLDCDPDDLSAVVSRNLVAWLILLSPVYVLCAPRT
jgi:hypothetical protein